MPNLAKIPLSAFDPKIRSLLERGCREYVEVPCDTPHKAHQLRNMLTMFRARCRHENPREPHKWEPLYGTIVSVKKGDKSVVTVRPRSSEFESILAPLNLGEPSTYIPLAFDPLADFEPKKEETEK